MCFPPAHAQRHTNLNAVSALGLLIILLLPLLAGTPVPVSVLMERAWWPWFNAGDVLLASAKVAASPGHWVMYRDVGSGAGLRAGNASTALGLLVELRCGAHGNGTCAGGVAGPTTATAFYPLSMRVLGPHMQESSSSTTANGSSVTDASAPSPAGGTGSTDDKDAGVAMPTYALILRRRRTDSHRSGMSPGAPAWPCPAPAVRRVPPRPGPGWWRHGVPQALALAGAPAGPEEGAPPPFDDSHWECAPVPVGAVLGVVAVRAPRAAAPAVPLCAARRWALDMRPPFPRLAPSVGAAWRRSRLYAWAVATVEAAEREHRDRVACDVLRGEARAATMRAETATLWGKRDALAAAREAANKVADPNGPCSRAAAIPT